MKDYPRMDTVRGVRHSFDGSTREYLREGSYTKNDDGMRVCPECNLVWQFSRAGNYGLKTCDYYAAWFPKYGKPKEICPKCTQKSTN